MSDSTLDEIRRAIADPGSHPDHHRMVMAKHRAEWPTLWRALDRLTATPPTPLTDCLDRWSLRLLTNNVESLGDEQALELGRLLGEAAAALKGREGR
jgi:hypothetical protein